MRSICRYVCPCLWYNIRFIHIFVVCCFNLMIKPDSSVAYGILFILFLCSDKVTFYWAIKGIAQRGRRHKCQSLENARNKPFSDSRYWTGTSLQLRLWYENDIPRKSLHCTLVPVPCREHEYSLFTYAESQRCYSERFKRVQPSAASIPEKPRPLEILILRESW